MRRRGEATGRAAQRRPGGASGERPGAERRRLGAPLWLAMRGRGGDKVTRGRRDREITGRSGRGIAPKGQRSLARGVSPWCGACAIKRAPQGATDGSTLSPPFGGSYEARSPPRGLRPWLTTFAPLGRVPRCHRATGRVVPPPAGRLSASLAARTWSSHSAGSSIVHTLDLPTSGLNSGWRSGGKECAGPTLDQ